MVKLLVLLAPEMTMESSGIVIVVYVSIISYIVRLRCGLDCDLFGGAYGLVPVGIFWRSTLLSSLAFMCVLGNTGTLCSSEFDLTMLQLKA